VAVLGASGYTGAEVARLAALHPNLKITTLTGDRQAGKVGGWGLFVCLQPR
jgi:N-acetyl-gamma-glutamyl-phosphate reductase